MNIDRRSLLRDGSALTLFLAAGIPLGTRGAAAQTAPEPPLHSNNAILRPPWLLITSRLKTLLLGHILLNCSLPSLLAVQRDHPSAKSPMHWANAAQQRHRIFFAPLT